MAFVAGGLQECPISLCDEFILLAPYPASMPSAMDSINFRVDGKELTYIQRMGHVLYLVKSLLHCGYPLLNICQANSSPCSLCTVYLPESSPDKCCQSSSLVRSQQPLISNFNFQVTFFWTHVTLIFSLVFIFLLFTVLLRVLFMTLKY